MRGWWSVVLFAAMVTACGYQRPLPTRLPTAVPPILLSPIPTPVIRNPAAQGAVEPVTTPTPAPIRLGAEAAVPVELIAAARETAARLGPRFTWVNTADAEVMLRVGQGERLARWVYAAAAPFATIQDSVNAKELAAAWQNGAAQPGSLLITQETAAAWGAVWGRPGPAAAIVPASELAAALWAQRPSWTLRPFHELEPRLKVLRVDGRSPLDKAFDLDSYPLVLDVGVTGETSAVREFIAAWDGPASNYDPGRITQIAMTGVTALTRATAYQMELNGILYPGEEVAPVLQGADIAHLSNEVSFAPDCPYPNPIGGTRFCSRDSYFTLLESLGIDVVELTGNHLNDYGPENLVHSLDTYEAAGMAYFGGGRNLDGAGRAAIFRHHGNQIAFVGCNFVGPTHAWAGREKPGARPCGPDFFAQITALHDEGFLVIATLQYQEFYHYEPTWQQRVDFTAVAAAGAAAVSGSQGHHAQGFDFQQGAFIHYGLGNLFFDQMEMAGTRQTLIDIYTIYNGRLLSVELWTGWIENYARPRRMTLSERDQILRTLFAASGW